MKSLTCATLSTGGPTNMDGYGYLRFPAIPAVRHEVRSWSQYWADSDDKIGFLIKGMC